MNTENKEKIKELKSDLFWYNVLLGVSFLATVLKISWMIVKYKENAFGTNDLKISHYPNRFTFFSHLLFYWAEENSPWIRKIKK